jgi:predicted acetyltransferase
MAIEDLSFRPATSDDLDRILEIHLAAFPDGRVADERRRNFTANKLGSLDDLVLAVRGDDLVGQAFLFRLEGWFGRRPARLGAIASLAVAPEVRGQGVATALLHHLHVASDVRGDAFTMLYAFRQRFYARLGYGTSSSRRRLVVDPSSIPASWRALARARVRRARGDDKDAIRAAYGRTAARSSGWLTRSDAFWERHLARERRHFLVAERPARDGGGVSGYATFELAQSEEHAAVTLTVGELAADDDVTRLALLGSLAAMRDQVAEIVLEVDADDPIELALVDSDARRFGNDEVEHDLGSLVGGPMVRIEDVPRAIEARGYAADGAFDVVVHAGDGEANGGAAEEIAVSVSVSGGRAEVSAARGASAALRTTRAALASLLYGALRPTDAVRLGLADADARTLARADAIFAMPPLLPIDPF